jgi:small subunit ribosomal protein S20
MPRTKSAVKRARQSIVRHERLLPYKTHMKTMMRKITDAVKDGKKDDAVKLLPEVYKTIDIATKKNLIHWKTAARKKALAAKLVAAK